MRLIGSFCVYRPPLKPPLNSLWGAMGSFGTLWDAIGFPVGGLLPPFGALWLPLGCPWSLFGSPLGSRGPLWPLSRESVKKTFKSGSQSRFFDRGLQRNRSVTRITGIRQITGIRTNPAIRWHQLPLGTSLPRAPGVRMT